MQSYNVAEAKAHLSEILERVSEGEEILVTRRGKPVARIIPETIKTTGCILGAGEDDPNIDFQVLASDEWWRPLTEEEAQPWYE